MRSLDEVLTYLEMFHPDDLIPARPFKSPLGGGEVALVERDRFSPDIRAVTLRIGEPYDWPSQSWNDERWQRYLASPNLRHWIVEVGGVTAGLVSLDVDPGGNTEFETFGLVPERAGGGLGGHVLTMAVRLAWTLHSATTQHSTKAQHPTSRLWLHTSSHDHPAALSNYQRRGFRIYDPATRMDGLTV